MGTKRKRICVHPVRAWMGEHSVTQQRLALESGVSQSYLSRVLSGRNTPSIDLALRLAASTGLPWADIMLGGRKKGSGGGAS